MLASRRSLIAGALLFGVAAVAALAPTGEINAKPPACVVAAEWVEANAGNLPMDLASLKRFDGALVKAIYRAQTPEIREVFWNEHLDEFVATHPDLTASQTAFVDDVRRIVHRAARIEMNQDEANLYGDQAIELFGRATALAAFVTLGNPTSDLAPALQPLENIPSVFAGDAEDPDCNCDGDGGGGCAINFECDLLEECDPHMFGCGFLKVEVCLGMCEWGPN